MKRLVVLAFFFAAPAMADSWRELPEYVEWDFKLGAVSVALEKCPFTQGLRYRELALNAETVKPGKPMRSFADGREMMLILDGPDKSALCGTAFKFFGPSGSDLSGVLTLNADEQRP